MGCVSGGRCARGGNTLDGNGWLLQWHGSRHEPYAYNAATTPNFCFTAYKPHAYNAATIPDFRLTAYKQHAFAFDAL